MDKQVLVITDNIHVFERFKVIVSKDVYRNFGFVFCCSVQGFDNINSLKYFDINKSYEVPTGKYDLILSLHCKTIFPPDLINRFRCVNVHPGFNPYNRGWYPQIFSILNKLPVGATIHIMNTKVDSGPVIVQKLVEVNAWDTSFTLYEKIIAAEMELLDIYLFKIIMNDYTINVLGETGNLNTKSDFEKLCKIDLDEMGNAKYFIDYFRALSDKNHKNLYFIDPVSRKKVYIRLELFPEDYAE